MSVKEARKNFSKVLTDVNKLEETYIITKFGKPSAVIAPYKKSNKNRMKVLLETSGIWEDRDIQLDRTKTRYEDLSD